MRFPQEFIEKVTEATNLVDIISPYTQLKRSGTGLMGRCPFPSHVERTASFSVSDSKQVYHCFGCGKSGNVFSFLRDYQGMSFPEAVEFLADRASIPLPAPVTQASQDQEEIRKEKRKQIQKANKWALVFFQENLKKLPTQHYVREYLKKRFLDSNIIETFAVGYAPIEWDGLVQFLNSKGISMKIAEEAQLIKPKQGGGYFDLFRDRLMFPIYNHLGEPIAFGGRIILDGQPKYLNSPETPVFSKSKTLYALNETAKFIRAEDLVIIVEGYMDAVALYQAGIKNVVAIMGTAMTAEHCKMIKRMTPHVLMLLDGDQAGKTAAERSLPIMLSQGLYPRGLTLPDEQDPDDFVKAHGAQTLQGEIAKSRDLFRLVLEHWMEAYKGEAQQKVQLADRARPLFAQMADERLKKLYVQEMAALMQVGIPWLVDALGGRAQLLKRPQAFDEISSFAGREASNGATSAITAKVMPDNIQEKSEIELISASHLEKMLLSLAIKSRANFQLFLDSKATNFMTHPGVQSVFKIAEDLYRQVPDRFDKLLSLLVTKVDQPESLFFNDRSLNQALKIQSSSTFGSGVSHDENSHVTNEEKNEEVISDEDFERETQLLKDCIQRVRESGLKVQLKKLALEMKDKPQADTMDKMKRLQDEIRDLNQSKV
jgi:DNA primase